MVGSKLAFGSAEDIAALQASDVFHAVLLGPIACAETRATFRTCAVAAQ